MPAWSTVLTSALLFAVGHLYQGVIAALVAGLLGAYFAVLFGTRRSLHRLALAHAAFNVTVLAFTLFA